jgi:hypothetical protein
MSSTFTKAIVIYHSADLDGHCSGAIAGHALGYLTQSQPQFIGYDHGQPVPVLDLDEHTVVAITDIAFPREVMFNWHFQAGRLIWIDHHVSSIEALLGLFFPGLTEVGRAACELAWQYFFQEEFAAYSAEGDKPLAEPRAVHLLGRYDVFDRSDPVFRQNEIMPFQYGMRAEKTDPATPEGLRLWSHLLTSHPTASIVVDAKIARGAVMLEYERMSNATAARLGAFECQFHGYRAICMTRIKGGSTAFESVYDPARHDVMLTAHFNGRRWDYSIYADKPDLDVGRIAISLGGGGHRYAAGFSSDQFLLHPDSQPQL